MKSYQVFVADFHPHLFSLSFVVFATILIMATSAGLAFFQTKPAILGTSLIAYEGLQSPVLETQSRFKELISIKTTSIPYKTKVVFDLELEYGITKTISEGKIGERKDKVKTNLYDGKKYATEVVESETLPAEDKVMAVGRKKIIKTLETQDGSLRYFSKLRMFSTSYDKNCRGCNETTAIGLRAGYGVVAVDPSVIPLRTKVYIPGYGIAIAGDTGGAVKGNVIDLGFDDVKKGWWSSRYTDVYLLE